MLLVLDTKVSPDLHFTINRDYKEHSGKIYGDLHRGPMIFYRNKCQDIIYRNTEARANKRVNKCFFEILLCAHSVDILYQIASKGNHQ